MGRVLKPSVKAISVSQTCCFPTEATCQSGDLQPPGKHTRTPEQSHTRTHKRQRGHTHRCSQMCIHVYLYKESAMMQRHRLNKYWHKHTVETEVHSSHTLPRARTNTWLVHRFTPFWKHRLINKSFSLETC